MNVATSATSGENPQSKSTRELNYSCSYDELPERLAAYVTLFALSLRRTDTEDGEQMVFYLGTPPIAIIKTESGRELFRSIPDHSYHFNITEERCILTDTTSGESLKMVLNDL